MKKIIICGYMGSGKTTIARLLALATEIPHLDLDEIIVREAQKSVQQIFEQDGEIKFRKMEHTLLKGLLDVEDEFILSVGGGTPCYANNHLFLQREDVISIYLKAGIPQIIERTTAQGTSRPLIDKLSGQELYDFIGQHLFERSYYYNHAKHTVVTDGKTPETIVNEIVSLL
ncbi:shikimate kinase [Flavobacterium akiainvivens]|uniref:Shikimate kinase n=1 Tax=Flavobacterium akiainvivens TaxID=1202724 RepID=A0A0M8MFX7_9FLAO|nr:shikimate kinase [Flavobacterium akiainvivens]KOS08064.1 shikimate kinase [Flavobacterium akiainvivens]SFQ62474.1 shikimate kinase [Flavobacterium akiainvivens]